MKNLTAIFLIVIFSSCATSMHKTGNYKVKSIIELNGISKVKFYKVKGTYYLFSDTVKVNDKIRINVVIDTTGMCEKINVKSQ